MSNISVEISTLVNNLTGMSLPESTVGWNFVGSVALATNTSNQPVDALSRPAPASYPEYLMAKNQINIEKGTYHSVWLTIHIPMAAEEGIYAGEVRVKSSQGEQSLPLNLTVFPLTLTEERHLKIVEWYTAEDFPRHHGINDKYSDAWFNMLKIYADNMVAH